MEGSEGFFGEKRGGVDDVCLDVEAELGGGVEGVQGVEDEGVGGSFLAGSDAKAVQGGNRFLNAAFDVGHGWFGKCEKYLRHGEFGHFACQGAGGVPEVLMVRLVRLRI